METLILHTTRGTLNPKTLEEARTMHNAFVTEGSQPGIDIARSLGDISHNVHTPAAGTGACRLLRRANCSSLIIGWTPTEWSCSSPIRSRKRRGPFVFGACRSGMDAGTRCIHVSGPGECRHVCAFHRDAARTGARSIGCDRCAGEAGLEEPRHIAEAWTAFPPSLRARSPRRGNQTSFKRMSQRVREHCSADRVGGDPRRRFLANTRRAERTLRRREGSERARRCVGRTANGVSLGAGSLLSPLLKCVRERRHITFRIVSKCHGIILVPTMRGFEYYSRVG
jgi:hypothetical protein